MHARPPRGTPHPQLEPNLDSFEASHRCVVVGPCHMPVDRCINTCRLHVHAPGELVICLALLAYPAVAIHVRVHGTALHLSNRIIQCMHPIFIYLHVPALSSFTSLTQARAWQMVSPLWCWIPANISARLKSKSARTTNNSSVHSVHLVVNSSSTTYLINI